MGPRATWRRKTGEHLRTATRPGDLLVRVARISGGPFRTLFHPFAGSDGLRGASVPANNCPKPPLRGHGERRRLGAPAIWAASGFSRLNLRNNKEAPERT